MTDMTITLPTREERKARQARLWRGGDRSIQEQRASVYALSDTPIGVPKVQPEPPVFPRYRWKFEDEIAWEAAICGDEAAPPTLPKIRVERIQQAVAEHFGVERADILSARRTKEVTRPRQVAMYLSKKLTPKSLPEIGRRFGGRDHTTVLHGARKIERLIESDAILFNLVNIIAQELGGSLE